MRNLVLGDYTGRVYVVNPTAKAVAGLPAYATVGDIPDDVDVAIVAVPAEAVQDVVLDCAAKGVHGLVVISSGFAETGEEGRQRQRRLVGLARSYGLRLIGPNCLGIINTDPRRLAERLAVAADAAARPGRVLLPVRRARLGDPGEGATTAASASRRSSAPATAPTSPATTCCSTGRRTTPPRSCCSTSSRSATRASSAGSPAGSRCASRSSRCAPAAPPRACRWATRSARSRRRRRRVDAMFRQAGVIQVDTLDEMFDVAQLRRPPAAAARAPGRDRRQLRRARAARRRRRRRGRARGQPVGRAGRRRDRPRTSRTRSTPPSTTPRSTRWSRSTSRRSTSPASEVANVLAAVGEQSDKPLVSSFLGAEGVPELLRVPDVAGSTAGRGSVPSYPAVEAAVRALARVVEYAVWLRTPNGAAGRARRASTTAAAKRAGPPAADRRTPTAPSSTGDELTALLAAYGIELWEARAGHHARGGRRRPAGTLGWDVVLKATADHLRERPDLAHVWRNIDTPGRDAGRLGDAERADRRLRDGRLRGAEERAARRAGRASAAWRTRCSGRWCRSAISGPLTELLGDRSYRIPPLGARDAGRDGPRDQGRAAAVRLPRQRGGRRRAGRGPDLAGRPAEERPAAGLARSSSSLVLAGADGCTVLTAARPGRPGRRPALGLVRAPAARRRPEDTHPGLSGPA